MVHGDLGQKTLKSEAGVSRTTALPEILVDDEDPLGGPAEGASIVSQGILAGEPRDKTMIAKTRRYRLSSRTPIGERLSNNHALTNPVTRPDFLIIQDL
jgi:hypothetical protein